MNRRPASGDLSKMILDCEQNPGWALKRTSLSLWERTGEGISFTPLTLTLPSPREVVVKDPVFHRWGVK